MQTLDYQCHRRHYTRVYWFSFSSSERRKERGYSPQRCCTSVLPRASAVRLHRLLFFRSEHNKCWNILISHRLARFTACWHSWLTAQIWWRPCHAAEPLNCINAESVKPLSYFYIYEKPVSWTARAGGVGVMVLWRAVHFNPLVRSPQRLHRSVCCHTHQVYENFRFPETSKNP